MIYDSGVALGEAYVAIRADLRPFTRDLRKGLKEAVDDFEKDLNKQMTDGLGKQAEKAGKEAGDGIDRGMKNRLGDKRHSPWVNITAALASALDDGISALPTEAKAAIVSGLIAASPFVSAALAGAVSAGIGVGVVGLGVALATQYEPVQTRFAEFVEETRTALVRSAAAFGPALIGTLDEAQDRIEGWEPLLTRLFDRAAPLLDPVVNGLLGAVEEILNSLDVSFDDVEGFVLVLSDGFVTLGDAVGDAFEILIDSGEQGQEGLHDLIALVAMTISGFAGLVRVLSEVYGLIRDLYQLFGPINAVLSMFGAGLDDVGTSARFVRGATEETTGAFNFLITATEREEKAAKDAARAVEEQARALDQARDAAFGAIDAHIGFERSLDQLHEALNRNGATLRFESEQGRVNLEKLGAAIRNAQKDAENRFVSGEMNWAEARKLYDQELAKIYKLAAAHGITKAQVDKVYGSTLNLLNLPNPDPNYWTKQAAAARNLANELQRALDKAARIRRLAASGSTIRWGAGQLEGFADGGIIDREQIIRAGEGNRPEVVIPLTKPARAAELADRSGLTRILGSAGATLVQVFVGDEPLEQKMYRVVQGNNRASGLALAHGPR